MPNHLGPMPAECLTVPAARRSPWIDWRGRWIATIALGHLTSGRPSGGRRPAALATWIPPIGLIWDGMTARLLGSGRAF
jgi:hypothetical protein